MPFPYVPSYLGFREVPFFVQLVDEFRASRPDLSLDLIFVDGNGLLHPRKCGTATHFGVVTGIPTIGIGKTFFHLDLLTALDVKTAFKHQQQQQNQSTLSNQISTSSSSSFSSNSSSITTITSSVSFSPSSTPLSRRMDLVGASGFVWGAALASPNTSNPIYVSVGHKLSLNTAVHLVQISCRHRIPEPVRLADITSREYLRQREQNKQQSLEKNQSK